MISGEKYELSKGKGNLIIISDRPLGKGTVCRALLEKYPDVSLSISATRKPRVGNKMAGIFFYTREEFLNLREKRFLEWAKVFDNYYGTPLKYVESILQQGQDCL